MQAHEHSKRSWSAVALEDTSTHLITVYATRALIPRKPAETGRAIPAPQRFEIYIRAAHCGGQRNRRAQAGPVSALIRDALSQHRASAPHAPQPARHTLPELSPPLAVTTTWLGCGEVVRCPPGGKPPKKTFSCRQTIGRWSEAWRQTPQLPWATPTACPWPTCLALCRTRCPRIRLLQKRRASHCRHVRQCSCTTSPSSLFSSATSARSSRSRPTTSSRRCAKPSSTVLRPFSSRPVASACAPCSTRH